MKLVEDYIEKANNYIDMYGIKTVLLMQVGTFYEIYSMNDINTNLFEIIHDISNITGLSVVEKSICVGEENVLAAGFRDYSIDKWLQKMQTNGYTCVVYSQEVDGKKINRILTGIYTPGTYIQLEDNYKNNNNMCVWIEKIKNNLFVGISNINIVNGESRLYEYNIEYKEIPSIYDEIEQYISVYNPSEITFISNLSIVTLNSITAYTNVQSITVNMIDLNDESDVNARKAKKCEEQKYKTVLFQTVFDIPNMNAFFEKYNYYEIATQSYCYLLNHMYSLNPTLVVNIKEPIIENITDKLILANHSSKQLNLVSESIAKTSSILNLTDNTMTSMGKRKYREILLNPTTNIDKLNNCYDITEKVLCKTNMYTTLRESLKQIHDIDKLSKLIIMKKLPIKSIKNIFTDLQNIQILCSFVKTSECLDHLDSDKISHSISTITKFICEYIDMDKCANTYSLEDNIYRKGIFPDLDKISEDYSDTRDILDQIISRFDALMNKKLKPKKPVNYLKLHETEKSGYSIQITKTRVPALESVISEHNNFELTYTSSYRNESNQYVLSNPIKVQKINNVLNVISDDINYICSKNLSLKTSIKELALEKYQIFLELFKNYSADLYKISEYVSELDIIQNRAYVADTYNYCKPKIVDKDKSYINATSLRHPIIEQINQNELYVANDVKLDDEHNILLFGTNAVGKTSFIKSIGIAVILAQSGMYVPAEYFEYSPYKELFTRILNCDNLFKGLSTFTLEMSEMSNILKYSNKNSLVLGDELCSGTELPSAMCIFISGLKSLISKQTSFIFATHFHELLEFDEIMELSTLCFKHMTVKYDNENNTIIYDRKLKDGPGERIYGLEVCKSLYMPDEFMKEAFKVLNKYYHKDILSRDGSRYNSQKIKDKCEICNIKDGKHIHHLLYQQDAKKNYINSTINSSIHKNHAANLINICEGCHDDIHVKNIRMVKRMSTNGYVLESI
jgi:DNA mismatch repair protein MutS